VAELQILKKDESKLMGRTYVEAAFESATGTLSRKDAIASLSKEMGVQPETVGLLSLDQETGTTRVLGRFHVYSSAEAKGAVHPKYLDVRSLTKEEKEKLKQAKKKKPAAEQAAGAK
jgi:ribosomal protein S24E